MAKEGNFGLVLIDNWYGENPFTFIREFLAVRHHANAINRFIRSSFSMKEHCQISKTGDNLERSSNCPHVVKAVNLLIVEFDSCFALGNVYVLC